MASRKFILAVVLLVTFFVDAGAQTKEETLQWLRDYGRDLLYYDDGKNGDSRVTAFTEVKEDGFYIEVYRVAKSNSKSTCRYFVPFKDILLQPIDQLTRDDGALLVKTNGSKIHFKWFDLVNTVVGNGTAEDLENDESSLKLNVPLEKQADVKRVLKAIYHYAKLVGAKEMPKVSQNTF